MSDQFAVAAPRYSRPAFVALLPGGRQDFPVDAIAEAYNVRNSRNAMQKAGIKRHVKRIPREEVQS